MRAISVPVLPTLCILISLVAECDCQLLSVGGTLSQNNLSPGQNWPLTIAIGHAVPD